MSVAWESVGRWTSLLAPLRKRLSYYWRRLLRIRATPHEVALGCAAGVFAACTPFIGFQMAMAGALAFLLRVSIPAAMLGTFIGNPLSWPAIWGASYVAGVWVLGHDPAYATEHFVETANALSKTLLEPSPETLDTAVVTLSPFVEPMVVGGLLVGLVAALFSYYPTRQAVRVFQKRRRVLSS
ncbi:DUF2062 domain-containing protein [Hyphomicrobium methylovorum]|uniref:DUF2062 domain-containing protein n=1 Tax=Hyphomicrobium methylovorum TaxID=84 RepID=UPI001FE53392|nr:DUF2062 domain-containing protein [Hyphomicrobium methylovorum]